MKSIELAIPVLLTLSLSNPSFAQKWDYAAYYPNGGSEVGSVTLEEKDGEATFRMIAPGLDACLKQPLKADVVRTATHLTITPKPPFPGCFEIRLQIRLDGTGGVAEYKRGDRWVPDKRDRKLTLAK